MDKYEEALAKARAEYEKAREQGYTWLMDLLEGMFPELMESEDERIRRHLIDIVETYWGTTNDPGKAADLAWLEKQKDLDKMIVVSPEVWDKAIADAYENGKKDGEKQKEQKPVEPCDGICCGDDRFKIIEEAKKDIIEKTNIAENELSMELPLLDGILMRVWQVGWLNKKQEPAKWSEEDEKKIHFLSRLIEFQVKDGEYCFSEGRFVSKQEAIEMLKSLRPSWKPSEEQMYILNWVANILLNHDGIVEKEVAKKLQSLCNDLNKLM